MCQRLSLLVFGLVLTFPIQAQEPTKEALWSAARKGDAAAVENLLAKGVTVDAQSAYGATALHFAAEKGHLEVVRVLLAHKADPNRADTFYKLAPAVWADDSLKERPPG